MTQEEKLDIALAFLIQQKKEGIDFWCNATVLENHLVSKGVPFYECDPLMRH